MNHYRGRNTRQQAFACFLINSLSVSTAVSRQAVLIRMDSMKDRIKTIRTYFTLSQDQFAKKIGRTKAYISNVENGHSGMSRSTISSICTAFSVREEWLRDGTGEMFLAEQREVGTVSKSGIAARVREVRKKEGLTQAEFAQRIGCHKNQVSNVESGKYIPSDRFLAAVSREFKVSVDWLRTGEADERDPVDDRLIEWLRKNPERARELRIEAGLD